MKIYWLKQFAIVLLLSLIVGCSRPSLNNLFPTEAMLPSPSSTVSSQVQGGQVAFVSDRRQRGNLDIWLFNLTDKQMDPLTSDDWQDVQPAWSPDGQTLAFISFMRGNPSGLRAVNLLDRAIRTLVPSKRGISVWNFVWSRDGKSIFYTTLEGSSGEGHIWQLDLQTGDHQHIRPGHFPLAISANDQYLAFSDLLSVGGLRFKLQALRVLYLPNQIELKPTDEHFSPLEQAWAPSENVLAVVSRDYPQIAIYTVEGEQINHQAADSIPRECNVEMCDLAWSPDGQKILAVWAPTLGNVCRGEVWLYDAGLAHKERLPFDGLISYPRWSPDGQWIIYSRNDTLNVVQLAGNVLHLLEGEIWIAEATGFHARPLIKDAAYNGQSAWRP